MSNIKNKELICCHCGDICPDDSIQKDGKYFCCSGCLFVNEILSENKLDDFYTIAKQSGIKPKTYAKNEFEFLDDKDIKDKLIQFSVSGISKVTLLVPEVYCSACIWVLENLYRLNKGIIESKVNFLKKEITISYKDSITSIREIVELLTSIGYRPQLNLSVIDGKIQTDVNKDLYIKLGVAGFVFGNIMLLALPEYFSGGKLDVTFKLYIGYISLFLSTFILFSSWDFFSSAYRGIKLRNINIDVPISIGILTLFFRSAYEIILTTSPGYVDSMSGLVFFLLIGRVFRQKTFHSLSFDRDFKSYLPLSVIRKTESQSNVNFERRSISESKEEYIPLNNISPGDILIIRNDEIIPCDCSLLSGSTNIDYSFVNGEAKAVPVFKGDKIYAGGKHNGAFVEVLVIKKFHQSYITDLWNHKAFDKRDESYVSNISDSVAKYFTYGVLAIAFSTFFYWALQNIDIAVNSFTAVLIVACPCALALTIPFTYGATLRVFSRNSFFLKNDHVVEYMAKISSIIFDKTGTLTDINGSSLEWHGRELNERDKLLIKSVTKNSTHPISRLLYDNIIKRDPFEIDNFIEIVGQGIEAAYKGSRIRIGKYSWINNIHVSVCSELKEDYSFGANQESSVFIAINDIIFGYFAIKSKYRDNIPNLFRSLKHKYNLKILSGDNDSEKNELKKMVGSDIELLFRQLPIDKLEYVASVQKTNEHVMMIGDGLNDAGALKQSNVGIAIADSHSSFTPGSDAILLAEKINLIPEFLKLSRKSLSTVYISFMISFLYNIVGLTFAVQGLLSPVLAAILMPVSSVSIILFTTTKVRLDSKFLKLL